ncbi:MAG TPA: alpha/beta hydrolase [Thermoanaerobaculia bacterium]|nr:alpha/beta hydrolase [Thermoanaerobaculia bacterium]
MHRDLSLPYVLKSPPDTNADTELPLVVMLHGRGADANDLADLAPYMGPQFRFVFPNAAKPFEAMPGYSFGFTWFDGWPAERNSLIASRELLLRFLDEITARYPTPKGKVILSGFSQGGLMSIDAGFRTSVELAALVVMSGALYEEDLPPFRRDLPMLMVHGIADDVIPVLVAHRARRVLEDHGVDVDYREFPMGHQVSEESMSAVADFMAGRLL